MDSTDQNTQNNEDFLKLFLKHATILHLMGVDPKKLTYKFQGRDYRLTDVHGHVVKNILS